MGAVKIHGILTQMHHLGPKWLWYNNRPSFLTKHGSHAYGTNTPDSDLDLRGFCIPPKEYFLGYNNKFEQFQHVDENLDVVIYDIRKFFKLAADCNPNIIEVLFTDPKDHVVVTQVAKKVLKHRELFLSSKAFYTFGGFAFQQLQKIKKTHAESGVYDFKDAMHLVRLMRVGKELLETGEVHVKRVHDREELLAIRQGKWTYDEVIHWASMANNELLDLAAKTKLPKVADHDKLEKLLVEIVHDAL